MKECVAEVAVKVEVAVEVELPVVAVVLRIGVS